MDTASSVLMWSTGAKRFRGEGIGLWPGCTVYKHNRQNHNHCIMCESFNSMKVARR